jgi:hypothetical protein
MIDGGLDLDLDAVRQNIVEAEVVCFYFPILNRTLLVDTRRSDLVGTFVKIVPMAQGAADRLRSLRRLRPQLPRPASLTMIPWDCRVQSLVSLGVWPLIAARLDAPQEAEACLAELCRHEQVELRRIIRGQNCQTLWVRPDLQRERAE